MDTSHWGPLIVLDGPNVAYAYAHCSSTSTSSNTTSSSSSSNTTRNSLLPNLRGIQMVYDYFASRCCGGGGRFPWRLRIMVVLPQSYLTTTSSSRRRRHNHDDDEYDQEQAQILDELRQLASSSSLSSSLPLFSLVPAPVHDDDDAYVLQIAQRERHRGRNTNNNNNATTTTTTNTNMSSLVYIVSNDLFRDAQARDPTLRDYLQPHGRISFTFCHSGHAYNDHGDVVYEFLPHPRHAFVQYLESSS